MEQLPASMLQRLTNACEWAFIVPSGELCQSPMLGALERDQSSDCRFLLVLAPGRPGRPPERGEVRVKARASHPEHLRGVIERRLVGERREFKITGARARDEHIPKQLAFGFVHSD